MPKQRSSSKPSSPIDLMRGAVGTTKVKTLSSALERFKTRGQTDKFPITYLLAYQNAQLQRIIPASRKIKDIGQLGLARPLNTTKLGRELLWSAVVCHHSASLIQSFLNLRLKYYSQLASGDYSSSEEILTLIDEQCGQSLWAIENRISLLALHKGFEIQKKYTKEIARSYPKSNIAFLSTNISERNESRVGAQAFEQRLRHRALTWEIDKSQVDYILFRLCNTIEPTEASYAALLSHDCCYSDCPEPGGRGATASHSARACRN